MFSLPITHTIVTKGLGNLNVLLLEEPDDVIHIIVVLTSRRMDFLLVVTGFMARK